MVVHIFIIESANCENRDQIFENREVVNLTDNVFYENLSLNGIDEMIDEIEDKFKDSVMVTFVDKQYQCKYYDTLEGKSELENLQNLEIRNDTFNFVNCDWFEFIPEFDGILSNNHYIFVSSKQFDNCYDMANFIQLPLYGNCYFVWNIKNMKSIINAEAYYNIFSNIPRNKQIDSLGKYVTENKEYIEWIVEEGIKQVQGLIEAGTLQYQKFAQKYVEEWTLNPYSYFSSGIIIEFDLKPKPPPGEESIILQGLTILEQFNEDAQYRYSITDHICRCLCKYGIEFNKITTINNNPHTVNFNFLLSNK